MAFLITHFNTLPLKYLMGLRYFKNKRIVEAAVREEADSSGIWLHGSNNGQRLRHCPLHMKYGYFSDIAPYDKPAA